VPSAPTTFVTRAAQDSDRDGLIHLIGSAYAEYPGCVLDVEREEPDLLAIASAYARHRGGFWVTIDPASGGLVASAGWLPSPTAGYAGWLQLRKLYVARAHRRLGLASALLARVETTARQHAAAGVELWSDTRFIDAHRFYRTHGYEQRPETRELFDLSQSVEFHFEKRL
jgi:putative acetyltransferase